MNKIRPDFPENIQRFFHNLDDYLDEELYFYGSVNRPDYVHGKSDIDIAVFTDNEQSVMAKLRHFIHAPQQAFDKIVWKLQGNMIHGYKIKCEKYVGIKCEIAVYNNDYKPILLDDMTKYNYIPPYIAFLLFILKTIHYTFPLITSKAYAEYKRFLFNTLYINKNDTVFYLLKQSHS